MFQTGSYKPAHKSSGKDKAKPSETKKVKAIQEEHDIFQELLAKERETSTWSAISLPTIAVLLLGVSIALIVLGGTLEIQDFFILGAVLLIGSVMFGLMAFVVVCRPYCSRNQVSAYEYEDSTQQHNSTAIPPPVDYFYGQNSDEDLIDARSKPGPSEDQLYGTRNIPPTPATATDVNLEPESHTPPPPRVAIPNKPHTSKGPVYTINMDEASTKNKDMNDLELL